MKKHRMIVLLITGLWSLITSAPAQVPSLIHYQGRLLDGTNLVNSSVGLSLRLFDEAVGGALLYEDSNTVTVVDGLYSTFIGDDSTFGHLQSALVNTQVFIEVAVNGTALSPRERVASVPYAQQVAGLLVTTNRIVVFNPEINTIHATADYATISGGLNNDILQDSFYATIGGGQDNTIHSNSSLSVIGGGRDNDIFPNTSLATIGGGWDNNIHTNSDFSVIGGGFFNDIFQDVQYATIGGGENNNIHTNSDWSVIGGGWNNDIFEMSWFSTIGGGDDNNIRSNSNYSVIGGGIQNDILGGFSTISGGQNNNIDTNSEWSVIGGGYHNDIFQGAQLATIGGGGDNNINTNSVWSVIGGGGDNNILQDAQYAIIPGGRRCEVGPGATNAFAAGHRAVANHRGAFVWADDNDFAFASTNIDQFNVRAIGGARFVSGISGAGAVTSGVQLVAGAGAWTSLSDVNAKENFVPVNPADILDKVAALPVSTWNYKTQDASIRHMGTMAQDFRAAFGVGDSPIGITTIDADGVALAAIQGLYRKNEDLRARLSQEATAWQAKNDQLKRENEELRGRLDRIEQRLGM